MAPSMTGGEARAFAVRSFFRSAFEDDVFPPQGVDEIFGCPMDNGIGSLTFNAWKTLWLHDKITEASVEEAITSGCLPQFFEAACRSLGDDGSSYTVRLCGTRVPVHYHLPPGELFGRIPWDRATLQLMTDSVLSSPATRNGSHNPVGEVRRTKGRATASVQKRKLGEPSPGRPWQCYLSAFIMGLAALAFVLQVRAGLGFAPPQVLHVRAESD